MVSASVGTAASRPRRGDTDAGTSCRVGVAPVVEVDKLVLFPRSLRFDRFSLPNSTASSSVSDTSVLLGVAGTTRSCSGALLVSTLGDRRPETELLRLRGERG